MRKFSLSLLAAALACLGMLAVSSSAEAKVVSKSKLRKVRKGVGNCVFADRKLPFEKEKTYEGVATTFATGQSVHARCYWPGQLKEFSEEGGWNELRQTKGKYRVALTLGDAKAKRSKKKRKKRRAKKSAAAGSPETVAIALVRSDGQEDWDQREYTLAADARRCLFPLDGGATKCLSLDQLLRDRAAEQGKKLPFAGEYCLETYVEHKSKEDENEDAKRTVVSRGCFTYEAKPAP